MPAGIGDFSILFTLPLLLIFSSFEGSFTPLEFFVALPGEVFVDAVPALELVGDTVFVTAPFAVLLIVTKGTTVK